VKTDLFFSSEKPEDSIDPVVDNAYITWSIADKIKNQGLEGHGATLAYSKTLINNFPPIPENCVYEDAVLTFRAEIIGRCAMINKPLVKYRCHDSQATNTMTADIALNESKKLRNLTGANIVADQHKVDLIVASSNDIVVYEDKVEINRWVQKKIIFFRNLRRAYVWVWPIRIIPLMLAVLSNSSHKIIRKDDLFRSILPFLIYAMIKRIRLR